MTQAWLIYSNEGASVNKAYIHWFIDEASKKGIDMQLILREEITIGVHKNRPTIFKKRAEITPPDLAVVRTIDPLLSAHLETLGVHVFNSSEVSRICNHKGMTHFEVQKLNVPMVDTYYYTSDTLPTHPPILFPFVIKNVYGRGGDEVFYIEDEKDWKNSKSKLSNEVIIQTANVQLGKDLRVYILGNEVIAAVLRESNQDFRANYTLGGNASLYQLNEEEYKQIERIYTHFNFDLVGIDFLIGKDGNLLFNEIEDIVGSRTLSKLSDINLLKRYTTHIINTLKNKKQNS